MIDNLEQVTKNELDLKNKQVEEALFETAIGYYKVNTDTTFNCKVDNEGKPILDATGEPIMILTTKRIRNNWHGSSVSAQKMWLEANNPEKYGNKNGTVNDQIDKVLNVLKGSTSAWDESDEDAEDDKEGE